MWANSVLAHPRFLNGCYFQRLLYSLMRGCIVNGYPYLFLNAAEQSYGQIAVTTVVMLGWDGGSNNLTRGHTAKLPKSVPYKARCHNPTST